jgi:hypothetical protein
VVNAVDKEREADDIREENELLRVTNVNAGLNEHPVKTYLANVAAYLSYRCQKFDSRHPLIRT